MPTTALSVNTTTRLLTSGLTPVTTTTFSVSKVKASSTPRLQTTYTDTVTVTSNAPIIILIQANVTTSTSSSSSWTTNDTIITACVGGGALLILLVIIWASILRCKLNHWPSLKEMGQDMCTDCCGCHCGYDKLATSEKAAQKAVQMTATNVV